MSKSSIIYLTSRISLCARLKTSMHSARSTVSFYPMMRQLSSGSKTSYLISQDGREGRFNVLELERNRITLTTNASSSPAYFMKESILRLVSAANILCEDYDIDFKGLIPYVVSVLSNSDQLFQENIPVNFDRNSDIVLSRRIIELINQKKKAEESASWSKAALIRAVSLLLLRYANGFEIQSVARDLGVNPEIINEAITYLRSTGHIITSPRSGKVEVSSI